MQISDILQPQHVKTYADCGSKKRLFHDIAELAAQSFQVEASAVATALSEREALGSTAVGGGVALPHARLAGLTKVRGIFVRFEKPLDFKAADKRPVDLVFTLLAPLSANAEHLKALALVSRAMREESLLEKLRANSDPATLHAILTEQSAYKAA